MTWLFATVAGVIILVGALGAALTFIGAVAELTK